MIRIWERLRLSPQPQPTIEFAYEHRSRYGYFFRDEYPNTYKYLNQNHPLHKLICWTYS